MTIGNGRMMNLINSSVLRRLVEALFMMSLFTAAVAHADSSCTSLLQSKIAFLQDRGGFHLIDIVVDREDVSWVGYSRGYLMLDGSGTGLFGFADQLFSDRFAGSQPFNINQADSLGLDVNTNGLLHIRSITWGFDTYWDLACPGGQLTSYFAGYGTITVAFRGWSTFIP